MSLRVVNHPIPGMPSTHRGSRAPQKAIAAHDTEGGTGEQAAWNTISWMVATAAQRNASYNEFWAFDEATGELLVIVVVPRTHAAHSIAPQPPPGPYEPDAKVRAALGSTVNDPNMWVYAVSVAGKVADVERYAKDPRFVSAARQRIAQLGAQGIGTTLLEHFRFQPRNRSDWGRSLTPAIEHEEDMAYAWVANIKRTEPAFVTFREETAYREQPDLTPESKPRWFPGKIFRRLVIGTVEGVEINGSKVWQVLQTASGKLNTAHSQDEVPGSRKPLVEEGETAGVPLASYAALALQAAGLMEEAAKGLINSAAVIRSKRP